MHNQAAKETYYYPVDESIRVPEYFNFQMSLSCLTINASPQGINRFLEKYGELKQPPKRLDVSDLMRKRNRKPGSKKKRDHR